MPWHHTLFFIGQNELFDIRFIINYHPASTAWLPNQLNVSRHKEGTSTMIQNGNGRTKFTGKQFLTYLGLWLIISVILYLGVHLFETGKKKKLRWKRSGEENRTTCGKDSPSGFLDKKRLSGSCLYTFQLKLNPSVVAYKLFFQTKNNWAGAPRRPSLVWSA